MNNRDSYTGAKAFRKKPVVIEATQWNESLQTLHALQAKGLMWVSHDGHRDKPDLCQNLRIRTLEGIMDVEPGAWIIRGVKGEYYACRADIFAQTYEAADAPLPENSDAYRAMLQELCDAAASNLEYTRYSGIWQKARALLASSTATRSAEPKNNS